MNIRTVVRSGNDKVTILLNFIRNMDEYSSGYIFCKIPVMNNLIRRILRNRVLVWYWREENRDVNFGDYISKVLIKKFGYKSIEYSSAGVLNILNKYSFCLLIIGSELHKKMVDWLKVPQVYIWGQGAGHGEYFDIQSDLYARKVKIFAVRGPHTIRQLKLNEKTPVGDPAFLMPLFFKVKKDPAQFKVTYIPHHSNREGWGEKMREIGAERFVDVMCSRKQFWSKLREIISSRFVLTNSLHTAIICQGYGVPWALCLAEGDELNFPNKWQDLFEFLNIDKKVDTVKHYEQGLKWWKDVGSTAKIRDLLPVLKSFPLPIKNGKVLSLINEMAG